MIYYSKGQGVIIDDLEYKAINAQRWCSRPTRVWVDQLVDQPPPKPSVEIQEEVLALPGSEDWELAMGLEDSEALEVSSHTRDSASRRSTCMVLNSGILSE